VALALALVAPKCNAPIFELQFDAREKPETQCEKEKVITPTDRLDASRTLTIDIVNRSFHALIFLYVRNPFELIRLIRNAASNVGDILLQFPLYNGILGMMVGPGLIGAFSDFFVNISTPQTFEVMALLAAGLVNFFVPSGSEQFAVQGPIMLDAADHLGVDPAVAKMAVSYGDQWTNMIQPFWALPLLAIARLKMRDILGCATITFLAAGLVFRATLSWRALAGSARSAAVQAYVASRFRRTVEVTGIRGEPAHRLRSLDDYRCKARRPLQNGVVTSTPKPSRLPRFGLRRNLLRPEGGEQSDRVTYIELLFDLIFVLALTQLSRYLYDNQSLAGALESAVLVLALWWVWVYTTWVTNWLDPARLPVRAAVIGLALVGLILSVSIFESFGSRGLTFAIAYVALQIGRTVFMIVAVARHDRALTHDFIRVLIWLAASGIFWILGGLLPIEFRIWFWLVALGIEYLSGAVGFRLPGRGSTRIEDWDISGAHIAERSALFVIISLGESFLVTGFAFVAQEYSFVGAASVLLAFVNAVTLWWLYFDHAEHAGTKAIARADKPGRIGNRAYTYTHAIIVAGIVLGSVADKEVLGHPDDAMKVSTAIVIGGGPFLYLVGLTVFRWIVVQEMLLSHIAGAVLIVVACATSAGMTPFVLFAIMTVILVATAAWETITRVRAGGDDEQAG